MSALLREPRRYRNMRWGLAAASFWHVLSIALGQDTSTSSDDDYTIFAAVNEVRSYNGTGQFDSMRRRHCCRKIVVIRTRWRGYVDKALGRKSAAERPERVRLVANCLCLCAYYSCSHLLANNNGTPREHSAILPQWHGRRNGDRRQMSSILSTRTDRDLVHICALKLDRSLYTSSADIDRAKPNHCCTTTVGGRIIELALSCWCVRR